MTPVGGLHSKTLSQKRERPNDSMSEGTLRPFLPGGLSHLNACTALASQLWVTSVLVLP